MSKAIDLKTIYAKNTLQPNKNSDVLNKRLFDTYNRIAIKITGSALKGVNIDLGSGDKGFSAHCSTIGIISYPYDLPDFDLEKDTLDHNSESIDFITLNAVIEHLKDPSNILRESFRVLKRGGLIFIRTPNWKMDYKNFFDDPTHVKPYSPQTLKNILNLFGFKVIFLEPGLIKKSWFWWRLPNIIKWKVASIIKGGTKSIICVGQKE